MTIPPSVLHGGPGRDARGHRWSGWPGGYCFYCGAEDLRETCAVECDPEDECNLHQNPFCQAAEDRKQLVDERMNPGCHAAPPPPRLTWKDRLYHWIDERNRIPRWVRWIFPRAHWCPDMDMLLVLDCPDDCFCGVFPKRSEP